MSWETKRMTPTSVGTIYSYVEVRDWETNATHSTYRHNGGATSDFEWHINVSSQLKWWENGTWSGSGSGSSGTGYFDTPGGYTAWCTPVDKTDSFVRKETDRTVWLGCESSITNNGTTASALAEIGPYTVPHLAGTPSNLSAEWSGGDIVLTWDNPASSYQGLSMEVSVDGGAFTQCWYYDGAGYPVTWTYEDADTGSSYEFRCRVVHYSNWGGYSNTATPPVLGPAAPTLLEPNAPKIDLEDILLNGVDFSWQHNSRGGLPQTEYELQWDVNDSGIPSSESGQGETSSINLAMGEACGAGDTVKWRVRTKDGNGWSDYSAWRAFTVITTPTVEVVSPTGSIDSMPIAVQARYTDSSACAEASFSISLGDAVLVEAPMSIDGASLSASLTASEFAPTNHETYGLAITVRSGYGVKVTARSEFEIDFDEPIGGTCTIENDSETGYATVTASFDNDGAETPAVSVSVSRVNRDGSMTPLLENAESGTTVVDRFAPLNTPYSYAIITHSELGAITIEIFANKVESELWFAYWGDNVAKAKWNPGNGGINIGRPQRTLARYPGRKDAVSYDGSAVSFAESPSWMVVGSDEIWPFVQLIEDGGRGVYKSCDGFVYHAVFDLALRPEYTAMGYYGGIALSIERIAGRKL